MKRDSDQYDKLVAELKDYLESRKERPKDESIEQMTASIDYMLKLQELVDSARENLNGRAYFKPWVIEIGAGIPRASAEKLKSGDRLVVKGKITVASFNKEARLIAFLLENVQAVESE